MGCVCLPHMVLVWAGGWVGAKCVLTLPGMTNEIGTKCFWEDRREIHSGKGQCME